MATPRKHVMVHSKESHGVSAVDYIPSELAEQRAPQQLSSARLA
jgi:hypothetical protein